MKALYITSIEKFSGKTAILLALGKRLQAEGYTIGYFKPVSYEATYSGTEIIDEDVTFVKNVLALPESPSELAGAVINNERLPACLGSEEECTFQEEIEEAYSHLLQNKECDVMLLEGGGSLRQGYVLGVSTAYVAEMLDSTALAVVRYRGEMDVLDDALTAQYRLGKRLLGVIFNRVPARELDFMRERAIPYMEKQGIPVLGALIERPELAAISVAELVETLKANVLVRHDQDALVETLMIGAMGAQEALSRFRRHQNKAVVTGGDRSDIQLAALDTNTTALILTGNLTPSVTVLERAEAQGVSVLLVNESTMETIEAIEAVFGKTRLGQPQKLARFEALMADGVDYKRLFKLLDLA